MRMKVEAQYKGAGVDYIFRQLQKYDTRKLQYVHIKTGRSERSVLEVYGNHRINRNRLSGEISKDGRINISIKEGAIGRIPNAYQGRMARKYGGSKFYCQLANNLQEAIVGVGMHEVYHWMAYLGYFGGDTIAERVAIAKDERKAMEFGWIHMACFRLEQAKAKGLVAA